MSTVEPSRARRPSLRGELLFNLAFLAAGALLLATVTAVVVPAFGTETTGFALLLAVVVADVVIFVAFGSWLVTRLVTRPIDALVSATEAVASGELSHRVPAAGTSELDALATSVNRMTARLLDAQGALVRAEKLASVGRLAAGIAHEVGNPLAAAGNYVEVLRRRGGDAELLGMLERELGRIDAIIRSLLDYARPKAAQRAPVDIAAVAAGAVELLAAQGVLKTVRVNLLSSGELPAVLGDATGLEQVCVNLLLNAVDAAGSDAIITVVTGPTRLGAGEADRRRDDAAVSQVARRHVITPPRHVPGAGDGTPAAQLVVADSGPGVPPDDSVRIFDPFFTTKDPGRGTGLGLAIVQRIVFDHGGRVDVQRAREGGAAFVVTLPAAAP